MPRPSAPGILADMRALPLLLLLAACGTPASSPEGRWFGPMTPDAGQPACTASRASLILNRGAALFTPDEGTTSLTGTTTPDGFITAERAGTGANKQPYVTRMQAHWEGDHINGTYKTPRCTFTFGLRRP